MNNKRLTVMIGYSEFVAICRVDDPRNFGGFRVEADGLYVDPPPTNVILTSDERAAVSWHPSGDYRKPALPLPCTLSQLRTFLPNAGLFGCLDEEAVDALLVEREQARIEELPADAGSEGDAVKADSGSEGDAVKADAGSEGDAVKADSGATASESEHATGASDIDNSKAETRRKRSALIKEVQSFWPTVESDLRHSDENGLSAANLPKHGYWDLDVALNWARENGKMQAANVINKLPGVSAWGLSIANVTK